MPGRLTGDNYLNVVLDTRTGSEADGVLPSWGKVSLLFMDVTAHRTGGKLGQAVPEDVEDGGDPAQYLVLTNNDFEEETPDGGRDYDNDTADIPSPGAAGEQQDDDLAQITLGKISPALADGKVEVRLSNPGAVRLFKDDGSLLYDQSQTGSTPLTLYLSSPDGYLADLRNRDVDVWLEGLGKDSDFTLSLVYFDAENREVARDEAHLTLAEWTFRGEGDQEVFVLV